MENYSDKIIQWLEKDSFRMRALACVTESEIPHAFLSAGFVRNLVWDELHHKESPTPLNDLDVIYFDLDESDPERYKAYELKLQELMPDANWDHKEASGPCLAGLQTRQSFLCLKCVTC